MKTRYKALILLVIIMISALAFYSYKRKQYLTLNSEDKLIIEKSLNLDSNHKGYSDKGQELMEEDTKIITTLSSDDKQKLFNLYTKEMRLIRIVILSKDQESYLKNLKEFYINRYCLDLYLIKAKAQGQKFNVIKQFGVGESEETIDYFYILKEKYLKNLSIEQVSEIINARKTQKECDDLSNIKK